MPLVATNAIIVTLILAYISYSQWQKNRLENEVLKEQLKLIIEFLNYMRDKPNHATLISSNPDDKIMLAGFVPFSVINFTALSALPEEKVITQQLAWNIRAIEWFNEVDNNIIRSPLFPKKIFNVLNKLNTSKYFLEFDVGKKWFSDQIVIPPENQLLLMKNMEDTTSKASWPLVFPYQDEYLQIKDVIDIYNEFNRELTSWFEENHINIELNITK
ncbi:hypothetical protein [Sulfuricurvum sp.]|uniref:hypothetical protein n=1 Tax=Sulfuricurvum sp. TaxID=2025608 RepID=UPI0026380058|nr:hypothetical protein [Sulfuricurvum sp.]MDD3598472.1 hypothetical protein [Sulfuricurvum sp.]